MIEGFEKYLLFELNRSRHTVSAYMRDIRQFANWITGGSDKAEFQPADVTVRDIRAWLGSKAKADSSATLRRKTQSLRAFYHWMLKNGYVSVNPAADVVLSKLPKHLPEFVKDNEIEELIESIGCKDDYKSYRAKMVLLLLYSTGIRQEELRTLTDADVDMGRMEIKVTGKRNKQRIIPVASKLISQITELQRRRDIHYPDLASPAPLIAGATGEVSRTTLYNIVHESLETITASHKSPHLLRHTFATAMLKNGASINSVKEFLGHSSLSTTQIYTHLTFNELRESYLNSHPRNRKD